MPEIIELRGFDETMRKLEGLRLTEQRQILAKAMRKAGKIISARAAQLAPSDFGTLRESQMVSVREQTATHAIAFIGPSMRAFYGLFQELGAAQHRPQAFLMPAYNQKADDVIISVGDDLRTAIEELAQ